jgi:hypothetical protein
MTGDEDPFNMLGIEASASMGEIRLAYRKLLTEHRDSGRTQLIPSLMRAYELALGLAQMRDEAAIRHDEGPGREELPTERRDIESDDGERWHRRAFDPFRRPAGGWSRDPLVTRVRRLIETHAFEEAVAVVTSATWQERLAEGTDAFAHATMRLACATVWSAPEAYERLAQTYIDRLDDLATEHCASALPLMLALDSDWAAWQSFRHAEPWLVDFLRLGMSGNRKLLQETSTKVRALVADNPEHLFAQLQSMASLSPPLVALTAHLARSIPGDLSLPTFPEQDLDDMEPGVVLALFPRFRVSMLLPLLVVAGALWPAKAFAFAVLAGGAGLYRDVYYEARYRSGIRRRAFELCVRNQISPLAIAQWAADQPWTSRARPYASLVDDVVLDAAYALTRLAHLFGSSQRPGKPS